MGLGAPKRRNKISHDPNNTSWANSTSNFGHRMLSSQGWKPGDYLGAENASHQEHYTAANASHIRVLLREDNLGLGAKIGGNKADTFGLSLFSGVLGRLNGKSDEDLEKQAGALRDAELRNFQASKYGTMNFVSGGLLIGDKIQPKSDVQEPTKSSSGSISEKRKRKADLSDEKEIRAKTPRLEAEEESSSLQSTADEKPRTSKRKKHSLSRRKQRLSKPVVTLSKESQDEEDEDTTLKHRKEDRRERESSVSGTERTSKDGKHRLKKEKRARKEERRKRKEEKLRLASESEGAAKAEKEEDTSRDSIVTKPTPNPALQGNRHAVRLRYIQQKRMASMNPQAMKEIFMLKASG